jgi:hypothetical protein
MMGKKGYPEARKILITADGGGSNGSRSWLWKAALQNLADKTGLDNGRYKTGKKISDINAILFVL